MLLVALFFIRTSFQEERGERKTHLFKDIREGLLWVWQQPIVRFLLILDGYLELFVSSNILLVAVIARNERIPLSFVGIILAAAGVGTLLGAACSPMLQRRVPVGWLLISTLLLFVLLWPLYGVVTNPWVLGSVIASLALLDSVAYLQTVSYRLAVVPDLLQGRVSSIARLVLFGSSTFGPVGSRDLSTTLRGSVDDEHLMGWLHPLCIACSFQSSASPSIVTDEVIKQTHPPASNSRQVMLA